MALRKVLLVDDEPDIRRIGQFSLTAVGKLLVVTAANGAEALEAAARESPDVILLDVMMPGMDGPTALQRLREAEATRHIPVIFMTARVQQAEVERYLQLGALGVIHKPFDPMGLPQKLRDILAGAGGRPDQR
ncbi:MAG: response regulator [Myxococcales bacterium]